MYFNTYHGSKVSDNSVFFHVECSILWMEKWKWKEFKHFCYLFLVYTNYYHFLSYSVKYNSYTAVVQLSIKFCGTAGRRRTKTLIIVTEPIQAHVLMPYVKIGWITWSAIKRFCKLIPDSCADASTGWDS